MISIHISYFNSYSCLSDSLTYFYWAGAKRLHKKEILNPEELLYARKTVDRLKSQKFITLSYLAKLFFRRRKHALQIFEKCNYCLCNMKALQRIKFTFPYSINIHILGPIISLWLFYVNEYIVLNFFECIVLHCLILYYLNCFKIDNNLLPKHHKQTRFIANLIFGERL